MLRVLHAHYSNMVTKPFMDVNITNVKFWIITALFGECSKIK